MSNGNEGNGSGGPRRRLRLPRARTAAVLAAVFAVGALGGGAVVTATDAWSHRGGWGHWGGSKGGHADPERWKGHMEDHALFWLERVDATDEQREAIRGIVGRTVDDLAGAVGEHRALRREWLTELERPELDTDALEALRAKHVALVDRKSRAALGAVVEAGSVLTAEQRRELIETMSWHRRGHHRGRRGGKDES